MKGFTLIEWVVVAAIIAILVLISVPRFMELGDLQDRAVIGANTQLVREALARRVEQTGIGFPEAITADMFPAGRVPERTVGRYRWSYDPATGTVSHNIPE
ncbi:MAG: hypothetical protein APR56_07575 [Methanosaeta sp. SDB]|nr:MAG: hypothetical protein APR56_07575 [Methanosaeta sp. SDB]